MEKYILVYLFGNAYQMILFNNTTILWILNTEFTSLVNKWNFRIANTNK